MCYAVRFVCDLIRMIINKRWLGQCSVSITRTAASISFLTDTAGGGCDSVSSQLGGCVSSTVSPVRVAVFCSQDRYIKVAILVAPDIGWV